MYDYGYRIPEEYICYTDSSKENAYRQALALLSLPEPPRAIICENNLLALSLCKALQEKRLRVPDDVAFLTFDSYPYSALIEPSPTIVDIDVYDLGVRLLFYLFSSSSCPICRISSFSDIILASSAATICAHSTSCSLMCSGAFPSNL